jgi:hypothetical protein
MGGKAPFKAPFGEWSERARSGTAQQCSPELRFWSMTATEQIHTRLEPQDAEALRELAVREDRSTGAQARRLLQESLRAQREREEADDGR